MFIAYRDHGSIRVPGERSEMVEIDGRPVLLRTAPAYLDTDGSLEPGYLNSPIRIDIVYTHYHEDGPDFEANRRVQPVVCKRCHDSGDDGRGTAWGCDECRGQGDHLNLHRCDECGRFSDEVLPVVPDADLNHELLLPRAHPGCLVAIVPDNVAVLA